jgi:hypothetical protein
VKLGRVIDAALTAWEVVKELRAAWQRRNDPPMRIDEMHVGATTEDVVERERAAAAAKWPDAETRLPRPPRVPRDA